MGILDRIKELAEGVTAQVNPFDGGRTYSNQNLPLYLSPPQEQSRVRPDRLNFSLDQGIGNPKGDFQYIPSPVFVNRDIPAGYSPDWFPKRGDPPASLQLRPENLVPALNLEGTQLNGRIGDYYGPLLESITDPDIYQGRKRPSRYYPDTQPIEYL